MYHKWGRGWDETADRTIPHRLFLVMLACLAAPAAEKELEGIRAVAGGMGLGMGGDKPEVQAAIRALVKAAFPERYDSP